MFDNSILVNVTSSLRPTDGIRSGNKGLPSKRPAGKGHRRGQWRGPWRLSAEIGRQHVQARRLFRNALNRGDVARKWRCERCERPHMRQDEDGIHTCRIEAHHKDYSKPLDVEWLCVRCHAKADREQRAAEQAQVLARTACR